MTNIAFYILLPILWFLIAVIVYRRSRKRGFQMLFLLFFMVAYINFIEYNKEYYAPSMHRVTLEKFIEQDNHSLQYYGIQSDSKTYYLVVPELSEAEQWLRIVALSPHPPHYIFDERGTYIDWSNHVDDDLEFIKFWLSGERIEKSMSSIMQEITSRLVQPPINVDLLEENTSKHVAE